MIAVISLHILINQIIVLWKGFRPPSLYFIKFVFNPMKIWFDHQYPDGFLTYLKVKYYWNCVRRFQKEKEVPRNVEYYGYPSYGSYLKAKGLKGKWITINNKPVKAKEKKEGGKKRQQNDDEKK